MRNTSFFCSLGSAAASKVGSAVLGMITFGFLARALGTDGLGQYRTVLALLLFAGVVFDFGLYSLTLRDISGSEAHREHILGGAVALRLVSMLVATVLLAAVVRVARFDATMCTGVSIAGVGWIAYQLNELLRAVFQLKRAQHCSAMAEMAGAILTLLLVIGFARAHVGTVGMLAATAAGFCLTAAVAWYFARRLVWFRPRVDLAMWRQFIVGGLPLAASAILLNIHVRVDVLLLSVLRSPAEVGLYDAPVKLYELLLALPFLLGGLMTPAFVRDFGRPEMLARRLNAGITATTIFSALAFAVLFECAEPIVNSLGGRDFAPSAGPLRILGASAGVAGLTAILRFAAIALNQQNRISRADLLGVTAAVTAHLILIPRFGFMGATFGRLIGDAVTLTFAACSLRAYLSPALLGSTAVGLLAGLCLIGSLALTARIGVSWRVGIFLCGPAVLGCLALLPRVRNDLTLLSA